MILRGGQRAFKRAISLDLRTITLTTTIVLLFGLVAYPFSLVLLKSFSPGEAFIWTNYLDAFSDELNTVALLNTLYVGLVTTALATLLGVVVAWLLARSDVPFKRGFQALVFLTFITPPYIGAVAWIQLLGRAGYISNLLTGILGLSAPPVDLYSLEGIVLVMAIYLYPLVFLTTYNALRTTDPSFEEAAALSGGTRSRTLATITLPLVLPSILSGAVLVFLQTVSCFAVPAALGLPGREYVLTTSVYASFSHFDVRTACALSIILVLLAGIALVAHNMLLGRKRYWVTTSDSRKPPEIKLGGWKLPVTTALLVFMFITVLLPLGSILLSSFLKVWGLSPALGNLTLGNYGEMFSEGTTARVIGNSLVFSVLAATAACGIGLISSYFSVRTKLTGRQFLDFLVIMPLAIPGPVIAIAMILAFINPPLSLYNTPWIIMIGYVVGFIPYAALNVSGALKEVDPSLEEAGWVSGASWTKTMKDITVSLIKPGLWTGWILVFLMALREIPISLMLCTQGTETIGVLLFTKTEMGEMEMVSTIAVTVMVVVVIGHLVIQRLGRTSMEAT